VTDTVWLGGPVTREAECVLAPNPGPMTLDGTNTWVLHAPGSRDALVVDPGPDDEGHLRAVLAAVHRRGARVADVLLTHGHADHSAGARTFAELAGGVGVRALDPRHRYGAQGLRGGDVVHVDGLRVDVLATPGHTGDSLSFVLAEASPGAAGPSVLTGDTVLGRGTTVVAHPDGRLGEYLASLHLLERLCDRVPAPQLLLPGHGPVLDRPLDAVRHYLTHRHRRLDQVRAALAAGDRGPREVVRRVYADVPPELWPAAELSVRAQLEYLAAR
jgi:glyoxylase-like metal-dependent hydrolase (beta-lactamase superfamily II)